MSDLNLLQRFYRVRDNEAFCCLHPEDRSFVGLLIAQADGYYVKGKEDEAKIAHIYEWEELSRFRRIEEIVLGR